MKKSLIISMLFSAVLICGTNGAFAACPISAADFDCPPKANTQEVCDEAPKVQDDCNSPCIERDKCKEDCDCKKECDCKDPCNCKKDKKCKDKCGCDKKPKKQKDKCNDPCAK